MKKILAVIAIVALISSASTIIGIALYENHRDEIRNINEEISYNVNAKNIYDNIMATFDEEAYNTGYTGIRSTSMEVNDETIDFYAFYIYGNRVSNEEFMNWVQDIVDKYDEALNDASNTINEQEEHLNNITLRDYLNCKFN